MGWGGNGLGWQNIPISAPQASDKHFQVAGQEKLYERPERRLLAVGKSSSYHDEAISHSPMILFLQVSA